MPPTSHQTPPEITFIHSADWQLGKPFASITDPAKRARVQQERFEAIRRIGEVVRGRRARFVVVAGDLFDSPTPTHATIATALGAIAELEVPVFVIPGNHDHAGPDSFWEKPFFQRERSRLAPNLHLLSTATVTNVALGDRGDGPATVTLLPCPLRRRREPDDPTAWIRDLDFNQLGGAPRIVIAHGSTTAFTAGNTCHRDDDGDEYAAGTPNTIAIDRLPIAEIDYVSVGDWHGFREAGPKAWYSGTPEIDRFPKGGQEPGHVACVTVARGRAPTVAAIRTGRFRWLSHEIALEAATCESPDATSDTAEISGPARLDEWLTEATQPQATGEPGFDGCLADIVISGAVSLAGRAELDRTIESWQARLLRLDLTDTVRIAPTLDEIHDLGNRPNDPIISRVAAELVQRLTAGTHADGTSSADLDVIRHAIFMLHALAHPDAEAVINSITKPGAISA